MVINEGRGEGRGAAGPRGPRKGGKRRPKVCFFCVDKIERVDYKDIEKLRKYISERGKIMPRRVTGNCAKHQRMMARAIKKARLAAFIPYTSV